MGIESRTDLAEVRKRVEQKRHDYIAYDFSLKKNDILKTFFDLAQEYSSLENFYRICVVVLHESLHVENILYLRIPGEEGFRLVCDSLDGISLLQPEAPSYIIPEQGKVKDKDSFLTPIYSNGPLDFSGIPRNAPRQIIGVLETFPCSSLTESDKFFLEKYTNRIGYNLRSKMLGEENIRHLKFINNLVSDIEHNVIIPNMHFKHLFNRLKKSIADIDQLQELLSKQISDVSFDIKKCHATVLNKTCRIKEGLQAAFKEIDSHHTNYSLFLESLFRRDHFERGCFVLRNKLINVDREIIRPQFAHYRSRFLSRNIEIKEPKEFRDGNYSIIADLGLLSQVYANLFSNAVKYTKSIINHNGNKQKSLAYGRKILPDYYGKDLPGIKLNVFTTGPHLSEQEVRNIFKDGFQGENKSGTYSRGHGLSFVKYVVELHGGSVGYEATEQGNNFYFILPLITDKASS